VQGSSNEPNNDAIARLLRGAGKRPVPPADAAARIHAHVRAEWLASVAKRRQQRWVAMAASLLVAAVSVWWIATPTRQVSSVVVARLEAQGRELRVGEQVRTSNSGLVMRIADATGRSYDLRLAANSQLRWSAEHEVTLLSGSLYVDTGSAKAAVGPPLVVLASSVRIEHIGTRFMTRLVDGRVEVAVRDGRVQMHTKDATALLVAGDGGRALVSPGAVANIERLRTSPSGLYWEWADTLSAPVTLEGQSLLAVLQRLAFEGGVELRFASSRIEEQARSTTLHGPALGLPPLQAMQAVLATTQLVGEIQSEGSQVLIRER
jgi:ferric-dicitrate binding protein FerR (iron transport regulator)